MTWQELDRYYSGLAFAPVLDKFYPYNIPAGEDRLSTIRMWRSLHLKAVEQAYDKLIKDMNIED